MSILLLIKVFKLLQQVYSPRGCLNDFFRHTLKLTLLGWFYSPKNSKYVLLRALTPCYVFLLLSVLTTYFAGRTRMPLSSPRQVANAFTLRACVWNDVIRRRSRYKTCIKTWKIQNLTDSTNLTCWLVTALDAVVFSSPPNSFLSKTFAKYTITTYTMYTARVV